MTREEELISGGWKKRFSLHEPRLSEMAAAYEAIGFEVRIETPSETGRENGCTECMRASSKRFGTVYTRKKTEAGRRRPGAPRYEKPSQRRQIDGDPHE